MSTASEKFEEKELHILKCAIQFFFRHIRFDDSTLTRMAGNEVFHQFDEREYHESKRDRLDQVLIDSAYETNETHIAAFVLAIMHQGLFSVTTLVIAIIYLSRFKEVSRVSLHTYTWRLLFLTALLVADKANEDKPIKNGSLVRLFPIVSAEELSRLEASLLTKIRFSIFIKSELFYSFVEKLLNESVSVEINSIVSSSDFTTQQLLPSMRTVPCTPEPLFPAPPKISSRKPEQVLVTPAMNRSRSQQPQIFIQNLMESTPSQTNIVRGRSPRRSPSSSYFEDNSLEYSRASSRRPSTGRAAVHVPPPPIFEPVKYQGHPRRLSIGRSPMTEPKPARPSSPCARSFISHRHANGNHRWNNMF